MAICLEAFFDCGTSPPSDMTRSNLSVSTTLIPPIIVTNRLNRMSGIMLAVDPTTATSLTFLDNSRRQSIVPFDRSYRTTEP